MNFNISGQRNGILFLAVALSISACGSGGGGATSNTTPATVPRFAYVANGGDNTVSIYSVNAATGQLRHNGYVAAGSNPDAVAVVPSGKFAYVANADTNDVSAYTIDARTGALMLIPCSGICNGRKFPAGTYPTSVTVVPSGKFAYVANANSGDVSAFAIDASNGALAQISCEPTPAINCKDKNFFAGVDPQSVTVDPTGKFVYVSNAGSDDISAYTIDAGNGALTQIPCVGEQGTVCHGRNFLVWSHPSSVAIDPAGKFGYVANYVSNDIWVFAIDSSTGSLTRRSSCTGDSSLCSPSKNYLAGKSPYSVSIDLSGKFAYVANYDSNDVSAYSIKADTGELIPIPCTGALGACNGNNFRAGTWPQFVSFDPSGKFVYVTNSGSNSVSAYSIASDGALVALNTFAGRSAPVSMAMTKGTSPVTYTPKFAYAVNEGKSVSALSINASSGELTAVGTPVGNAGDEPYAVAIDPAGRFAYVANYYSGTVSSYAINGDGKLSNAGSVSSGGTNSNPYAVAVDPSGRFVYVANWSAASVAAFSIDASTGVLTQIGSDTATGANPTSVNVDPSGRFVYITNQSDGTVSAFSIDGDSGALTHIDCAAGTCGVGKNFPSGGRNPLSVAIDPTGKFAYVANADFSSGNASGITAFAIDSNTGALGSIGAPIDAGTNPYSVAVDPGGRFAFAAESNTSEVVFFFICPVTGALTRVGAITDTSSPFSVTVDPSGKFAYVANVESNTVSSYRIGADTGALTSTGPAKSLDAASFTRSIITTGTWQ